MIKVLTSILTLLAITGLHAQSIPGAPKLVIGLTIDQLRTDYMEAFSSLYGEKGFKRLKKEGRIYNNAEYPFNDVDRASAIATLYTGTSPFLNGIVAETWMDPATLRPVQCVDDRGYLGYYTLDTSSPSQLLTSTLTDELKIATQGQGLAYAIAPFRDAAILGAGHAGDGAFWLDEVTGKWCGTTYYKDFPSWVSHYNDQRGIDFRIDDMAWTPLLNELSYFHVRGKEGKTTFKHKFSDEKRHKFKRLVTSPLINDEVNLLVDEFIKYSDLGRDNTPDVLSLTYYAGNYNRQSIQDYPLEIQDVYARLDKSIAQLLDMIDKSVGLQNTIIFITSTGCTDAEAVNAQQYRIPTGDFFSNRCTALLNMYLMATYGEGHYVDAYYNKQIYLNHKLIEQKQLDIKEVLSTAADFLVQFSGVNEVYSSHRLLLGSWTPEIQKVRNGYHRKRSGDLVLEVMPGWTIRDDNSHETRFVRQGQAPAPLIFMGYAVKPAIINTPVTIDHVAPTMAHFMRIRAPNGCTVGALTDVR